MQELGPLAPGGLSTGAPGQQQTPGSRTPLCVGAWCPQSPCLELAPGHSSQPQMWGGNAGPASSDTAFRWEHGTSPCLPLRTSRALIPQCCPKPGASTGLASPLLFPRIKERFGDYFLLALPIPAVGWHIPPLGLRPPSWAPADSSTGQRPAVQTLIPQGALSIPTFPKPYPRGGYSELKVLSSPQDQTSGYLTALPCIVTKRSVV